MVCQRPARRVRCVSSRSDESIHLLPSPERDAARQALILQSLLQQLLCSAGVRKAPFHRSLGMCSISIVHYVHENGEGGASSPGHPHFVTLLCPLIPSFPG